MTTTPSSPSPPCAAVSKRSRARTGAAARVSGMVSLALLGWLAATAPSGFASEACQVGDATLADAVRRHQAGDVAGAIDPYRRYLDLCPKRADVRSNLGAALAHLGRYDEAV